MKHNELLIKGSLSVIILRLLQNNGKRYGYEMVEMIRHCSQGNIEITDAALYKTLHQLEEGGYIILKEQQEPGKFKKYYQLSRKGRYAAEQETLKMKSAMSILQKILRYKM